MEQAREPIPDNDDVLDAYSQTVMRVAADVTPHVAAIEMSPARRNGRVRVGGGAAFFFCPSRARFAASRSAMNFRAFSSSWRWIAEFTW